MSNRVTPADIGRRRANMKLAKKKMKEVRCELYTDQIELLQEWCVDYNTTPTNVMRKLFNYFLHMNNSRRERIIREY